MLRWYFIARLVIVVLFFAYWQKNPNIELLILLALFIDFVIFPIVYLIYSFVRKRKLAPGEYAVKPEGKRL